MWKFWLLCDMMTQEGWCDDGNDGKDCALAEKR